MAMLLYPRAQGPRYPLARRLGGHQSRSEQYGEVRILDPIGAQTVALIVQAVATLYSDCSTAALHREAIGTI
jgi:hypothetical protein